MGESEIERKPRHNRLREMRMGYERDMGLKKMGELRGSQQEPGLKNMREMWGNR